MLLGRCCIYAKDIHLGQRIVFDIKLWKIFRIYATDSERFAATWTCFQQEKLNYGDTALYFSGIIKVIQLSIVYVYKIF